MRTVLTLLTAAALLALAQPPPTEAIAQPPTTEAIAQTTDLSGRWRVDYELSDTLQGDPPTASGDGDRRRRGGGFGGFGTPGTYGRGGFRGGRGASGRPDAERERGDNRTLRSDMRAAFADLLTAPRRMTIVQREREVVLTYDDGRAVRLVPDGREHAGIAGPGVTITRKTRWDNGALRAELRMPSGPRLTHLLQTRLRGAELVVTTTVDPRDDYDGLELRRVYRRE